MTSVLAWPSATAPPPAGADVPAWLAPAVLAALVMAAASLVAVGLKYLADRRLAKRNADTAAANDTQLARLKAALDAEAARTARRDTAVEPLLLQIAVAARQALDTHRVLRRGELDLQRDRTRARAVYDLLAPVALTEQLQAGLGRADLLLDAPLMAVLAQGQALRRLWELDAYPSSATATFALSRETLAGLLAEMAPATSTGGGLLTLGEFLNACDTQGTTSSLVAARIAARFESGSLPMESDEDRTWHEDLCAAYCRISATVPGA